MIKSRQARSHSVVNSIGNTSFLILLQSTVVLFGCNLWISGTGKINTKINKNGEVLKMLRHLFSILLCQQSYSSLIFIDYFIMDGVINSLSECRFTKNSVDNISTLFIFQYFAPTKL